MSYSSRPDRDGRGSRHLDVTGDREVVFCHRCSHEWYNDEYGMECPHCESEFCEIITPENDPRPIHQPDVPHHHHEHDHHHDHDHDQDYPDPDEDDIGVAFPPRSFLQPRPDMDRNRQNRPVDPNSEHEIFTRFQETLHMLGVLPHTAGRPNRDLFGASSPFGAPGGTTQTTTYNTPGGRTTFSITTSTLGPRPGLRGGHPVEDGNHDHGHNHGFDLVFSDVMGGGNIRPPEVGHPPFENTLQGLLSMILSPVLGGPNAVHGDAVYSQEALDRIVSQLMEAHPQSNAAPPASQAAIENLEKKKLDRDMMGDNGKAECTICIDEMHIGDEVNVLPCKHWFHEECVVLWLREHNTCPVCRNPIEKREGNSESSNSGGSSGSPGGAFPGGSPGQSPFGGWFGGSTGDGNPWSGGANPSPVGGSAGPSGSYQSRSNRSPEERQARLNSIRNLAGPSSYGQQAPSESSSSRFRRDSWSPTSPPAGAPSTRERSPARLRPLRTHSSSWSSQRSGRNNSNSNHNGNNTGGNSGGSSNPISWLRGRFSGGGSGSGSNDNGSGRRRS